MRFLGIIIFLTGWLLCAGVEPAVSLDLVSRDAAGDIGQADSGSIQGGMVMRPATVLDDGTVFFLSLAKLTPTDTNSVVDYFCHNTAGIVTAVDLPAGLASGNCFWGGVDASGTQFYIFRQFSDPFQFELQFGSQASKTLLGVYSHIINANFARGGGSAVYERNLFGFSHLYLHDLNSASRTETQFTSNNNGNSRDPAISANGATIVFSSTGSNVVPHDNNEVADVFLYDCASGGFTLISQRQGISITADAVTPDISADGQTICFASADANFVPNDTNTVSDVFVYQGGNLQRCNIAVDGTQADADSNSPRLNADGRFIVFASRAGNLMPGVNNGRQQIFLVDRDVGTIEALSLDSIGTPADADCFAPAISPGGRYVTFQSKATNLVNGATAAWYQVYRVDRGPYFANHPPIVRETSLTAVQGQTIRFTLAATDADGDVLQFELIDLPTHGTLTDVSGMTLLKPGQIYEAGSFPWQFVPADGTPCVGSFTFRVTDGKAFSAVGRAQIRMVDPDLGAIIRVSVATDGTQGTQNSYLPYPGISINADGTFVAFCSQSKLDDADNDISSADVFLRDTVSGSTRLITTGIAANRHSYRCALSGDGRSIVYYTEDGNALILQDLTNGGRTVIANISSYLSNSGPTISYDGSLIVYEMDGKVWLFKRKTGTVEEVSVNSQGDTANANCNDSAFSANGEIVAFSSAATNLDDTHADGIKSVYLRLLGSGQTILISKNQADQRLENAIKPALSGTGRFVVFLADDALVGDGIGTVYVKNVATGALRQIAVNAANPAISADGRFVCYTKMGNNGKNQLYRVDLIAVQEDPQLVSNVVGQESTDDSYRAVISNNGQRVFFASKATNLVIDDTNDKCDIFLNDFGLPQNNLPVPTLTKLNMDMDTSLENIILTYTDTEDNDVSVEIISEPQHALRFVLCNLQPGQAAATISYTPIVSYHGQDSFTYRCGDAEGWSAPITVTITIWPTHKSPHWLDLPVLWRMQTDEEFRLDLSRFVDTSDIQDTEPNVLVFSLLQGSPETWIDGNFLVISADGVSSSTPITMRLGVKNREDGPVIEFDKELAIHVHAPVEIPLASGWNLISFPMTPEPSDPTELLSAPTANPPQRQSLGHAWYVDTAAGCYCRAETLEPKRGYWVWCPKATHLVMEVAWMPPVDQNIDLGSGWNLVGPVGFGEIATPTVAATGAQIPWQSLWQWNGAYYIPSLIQSVVVCGSGSWIYTPTAQAVTIELGPIE